MTTDKTGAEVTVSENLAHHRYDVFADGELAGYTVYRDRRHDDSAERIFYHTEVGEAFGGRGLATILVKEALDATRAENKFIVGVCPLVASFLKNHPEYADASHPVTDEVLTWLQS
ncbi:N-acetyltransferase [Gordonia sp. TBRC 11910]|uniref:N-acetyltransferase n=1 Tax=Gordonia asplenii TaxID=2725283 RepID=A0A848L0U1_9ACTN|nr:GNAT family N-acetyltransferase [Gordonia asplenii]NMO02253.1 N-acetyltransferase [Gordonia asplenii]